MEAAKPEIRSKTIRLSDGRMLGFTEWGDPRGTPVLEFRGLSQLRRWRCDYPGFLPASRIRRITVDRPGTGTSDYLPGRRLLDWPDDGELADALGTGRFSVLAPPAAARTPPRARTGSPAGCCGWRW